MATKRNNVSLAPDLEFISKDTGLDVETITEKAIRVFIARYTLSWKKYEKRCHQRASKKSRYILGR